MKKSGTIELFRFVFSILIVLVHFKHTVEENPFNNASIGVEFFLLVSGFLMMASITKIRNTTEELNIGLTTFDFIKKKVIAFLPYYVIAMPISFVLRQIVFEHDKGEIIQELKAFIWEFLLIEHSGIGVAKINPVVWYLSAMLIGFLFLVPIALYKPDIYKYIIAPLIVLFAGGFLFVQYEHLRNPQLYVEELYVKKGMLRTLMEMALGSICYYISIHMHRVEWSKIGRAILHGVEMTCYLMVIRYAIAFKNMVKGDQDFVYLFLLAIAITITFGLQTNKLLDNKVSYFLGKLSLPVYLCHYIIAKCLGRSWRGVYEDEILLVMYLCFTLIFALLVFWAGEAIKRNKDNLKGVVKKIFVSKYTV